MLTIKDIINSDNKAIKDKVVEQYEHTFFDQDSLNDFDFSSTFTKIDEENQTAYLNMQNFETSYQNYFEDFNERCLQWLDKFYPDVTFDDNGKVAEVFRFTELSKKLQEKILNLDEDSISFIISSSLGFFKDHCIEAICDYFEITLSKKNKCQFADKKLSKLRMQQMHDELYSMVRFVVMTDDFDVAQAIKNWVDDNYNKYKGKSLKGIIDACISYFDKYDDIFAKNIMQNNDTIIDWFKEDHIWFDKYGNYIDYDEYDDDFYNSLLYQDEEKCIEEAIKICNDELKNSVLCKNMHLSTYDYEYNFEDEQPQTYKYGSVLNNGNIEISINDNYVCDVDDAYIYARTAMYSGIVEYILMLCGINDDFKETLKNVLYADIDIDDLSLDIIKEISKSNIPQKYIYELAKVINKDSFEKYSELVNHDYKNSLNVGNVNLISLINKDTQILY